MKYFKDPITGNDWHCSDIFNWMAVDENGSLYVYQKKAKISMVFLDRQPSIKLVYKNYWSGGRKSQDLCAIQRDGFYKHWEKSLCKLTN